MMRAEGISKAFGSLQVLDGLDLALRPGRVTAIVGPNGSGKTTLIKCLLGLVRRDGGEIYLNGERVGNSATYRQDIGYMPQIARMPENLTGAELIAMLKDLRGIRDEELDEELVDLFDLEPHLRKPLGTLSGGTRQKVNAVCAFMFRPRLLVLDEATAGLDPVASGILKDKVLRERSFGRTVVITSHIVSELEELADDVAFLLEGRVRFTGSVAQLVAATGQTRLERAIARLMMRGGAALEVVQ